MAHVVLPPHQLEELHKIQRGMLAELAEALDDLDEALSADLKAAIIHLDRNGWKLPMVRARIGRVLTKYWNRVDQGVLALVDDAARHAETYMQRLVHFGVMGRTLEPIQPSKIQAWTKAGAGRGGARAVLAYVMGKPAGTKTAGKSPRVRSLDLSRNIHRFGRGQLEEVTGRVIRAVREAQGLEFAGRELVTQWKRGKVVGGGEIKPRVIREIEARIDRLGKLTGDDLKQSLDELHQAMRKLKQGGRMKAAYAELIEDLDKGKIASSSLDKWVHQKQRYVAERIVETETQGMFRLAQVEAGDKLPWIIGYRWHMNRAKHRRWKYQKPGKFSGARARRTLGRGKRGKRLIGKSCVCEAMAGTVISPEEYKSRWIRGGHPHCACFFEEVFSEKKLLEARETPDEKKWLDKMGF